MGKNRTINTAFWIDNFIEGCTAHQKLIFLYLLSCPSTNMLGVYEITMKRIAFDTGLSIDQVKENLEVFQNSPDPKVSYVDGYIMVANFSSHQNYNGNMTKSAIEVYNKLPDSVKHHPTMSKILDGLAPMIKEYKCEPIKYNPSKGSLTREAIEKEHDELIQSLGKDSEGLSKGFEPFPKGQKPIGNIKYETEYELEEEREDEDEDAHMREDPPSPSSSSENPELPKHRIFEESTTAARRQFEKNRGYQVKMLAEDYLKDEIMMEMACMKFGLDPPTLARWMEAFTQRKLMTGEKFDTWKNFCGHFINWMGTKDLDKDPSLEKSHSNESKSSDTAKSKPRNGFQILSEQLGNVCGESKGGAD